MSLEIGTAFREGVARTVARNGLVLVAVFAAIAVVTAVLFQTFLLEGVEALVEFQEGLTPEEMGVDESEYEQSLNDSRALHDQFQDDLTLAVGLPVGVAAGGLLVLALLSEAATIVAIRVFATSEADDVQRGHATDNVLLATLNGFVGGIVAWGLILVGSLFLLVPGIFFAVAFFFYRQEVALNDENFVQALADSWRLTKGNRVDVFALGLVLVLVVWSITLAVGGAVGLVSTLGSDLLTAILGGVTLGGGVLGVFGTAVATRAYVQLDGAADELELEDDSDDDPYAAALGPDDIPE